MMRNWGLVFIGNFAGAILVALMMAVVFTFGFSVDPNEVGQRLGEIGHSRTVGYAEHGAAGHRPVVAHVALLESPRDGAALVGQAVRGPLEVPGAQPEDRLVRRATEERGRLRLRLLDDLLHAPARRVGRPHVRARLAQRPGDRLADLVRERRRTRTRRRATRTSCGQQPRRTCSRDEPTEKHRLDVEADCLDT